ncbi:MAG: efflux RND transporter periplasmic adaptor subunit, partial [Acidobacteria bacterium]|nr:efflux RND transporter periplasmic adaptor subunit [Acidobacteriota bacterium]
AWLAPDGTVVHTGEVIARIDPTNLEMDMADGMDDLEIARLKILQAGESQASRSENLSLDSGLAQREEDYTRAFSPRDPLIFSRHEIIDSEIDRELSEGKVRNTKGKLEIAALQGKTELEMLRIDRTRAEQKVGRARKGLAALEVRAPHDGILLLRRSNYDEKVQPGMDVWPGMTLAEIPDPATMQARVYVLDADAAGLKAGCRATLRVEAHPNRAYAARVERVDPLAKRRTWDLPVEYFEAVLTPDRTDAATMKPGQGVGSEITLEEIGGALTIPPQAIFQIKSKPVAFRREGGHFRTVPIRLGSRSLSRVQILSGLKEGDVVALRDPRKNPSFDSPAIASDKPSASPSGKTP